MVSVGAAIWAESLTKTFRSGGGQVTVFRDLSLSVSAGERLAIIGESGAGKSTLLHLIGGLDRPSKGRVICNGCDLSRLAEDDLAELRNTQIGFVWQNPSLLSEFTAAENVMMPLLIRGADQKTAGRKARELLNEVGLSKREGHRPGELSGGEQQRAALARALVTGPRILLADEPTGGLDHRTGQAISELLAELHASHRLTSVFVTHNLPFAEGCDRILELREGTLHTPSAMELQETGVARDATRLSGGTYV